MSSRRWIVVAGAILSGATIGVIAGIPLGIAIMVIEKR